MVRIVDIDVCSGTRSLHLPVFITVALIGGTKWNLDALLHQKAALDILALLLPLVVSWARILQVTLLGVGRIDAVSPLISPLGGGPEGVSVVHLTFFKS